MRILWVATKAPWPAVDGGRLLMQLTLEALAEAGHGVTVVAPTRPGDPAVVGVPKGIRWLPVEDRFRPKFLDLVSAWPRGRAFSSTRHHSPKIHQCLCRLLQSETFDVVHVEQVQGFTNVSELNDWLGGSGGSRLPIVLRAQNVESDLWRLLASRRPLAGPALRWEARLLARAEAEAVRRCRAVAALTSEDAQRLSQLAEGRGRVTVIPPPFPDQLPPAHKVLEGDPALVLFGSSGWLPNREGADWFLRLIWPEVARRHAKAILHVFGAGPQEYAGLERVEGHPSPDDSRSAFAPGSILVVPLSIASGIRMKILEAWARGVAVIATPTAAAGLAATAGEHLFEAQTPEEFAAAVAELSNSDRYGRSVEAGRSRLKEVHSPKKVAASWLELYDESSS